MGEPSPDDVRARLLPWYDANRRDLPWRRTRDPYRILVAEYLLQRTRIKSGTPYYERFLKRFPTVQDLAAAPLDDVLAVWEGLGFYGRARNLHAAARALSIKLCWSSVRRFARHSCRHVPSVPSRGFAWRAPRGRNRTCPFHLGPGPRPSSPSSSVS